MTAGCARAGECLAQQITNEYEIMVPPDECFTGLDGVCRNQIGTIKSVKNADDPLVPLPARGDHFGAKLIVDDQTGHEDS